MEENEAIDCLRNGDLSGLEVLIDKYYLQAVRAAYFVVLDQSQAEDIVQASFLRAVDKIEQFDLRRNFRPWFLRCVVNHALNEVKKENNNISLDKETIKDDDILPVDWLQCLDPGPEENMILEELQQTVWKAINKLTPNQRSVVVMRYFLDLSETEMTMELNSPVSSIKWWLFSARQNLRNFLQFNYFDDSPYDQQITPDQKKE
jgi:RNA polymerase sigma-70 factor, ECF subfamily